MNVILLTVPLSLLLGIFFLVLFVRERQLQGVSSPEQDALRPLDQETPKRRPSR